MRNQNEKDRSYFQVILTKELMVDKVIAEMNSLDEFFLVIHFAYQLIKNN